ncbi:MAG: hypothetical protein H7Z21_14260 [Hymenobacter sp.]|nr:hypothetical protein [Hymenobacter sp.]
MSTLATRNLLLILLGFLGVGALGGGALLTASPSGKLMGMPLSMLAGSPFTDFLMPGLILFIVLGVAPCLLVMAMLKKPESALADQLNVFRDMHWAWTGCIYVVFALVCWLQLQMVFLNAVSWLHTFYMLLALAILAVALLPKIRAAYAKG